MEIDRMWYTSLVKCRVCGAEHVSVWPDGILDPDNQQCHECGHMTAQPIDTQETEDRHD